MEIIRVRSKNTLGIVGLLTGLPLYAGTMGEVDKPHSWFASIGTGYSWTLQPGIDNPNPSEWDFSAQGYDSPIGDRGFYTFAAGRHVQEYLDVSLSYLVHENFNYQKFQTGDSATPDFTGTARNRFFTLNNRSLLVNVFLHPAHYWANFTHFTLTPYVGAGIGYAYNKVNNFYTVATTTVDGTLIGSTDSVGTPIGKNSFACQGTAAINILSPQQSHFSLNTGYRYYYGGKFNGSSSIYTNANGFVAATPWSGSVQANQFFVEFQYNV